MRDAGWIVCMFAGVIRDQSGECLSALFLICFLPNEPKKTILMVICLLIDRMQIIGSDPKITLGAPYCWFRTHFKTPG